MVTKLDAGRMPCILLPKALFGRTESALDFSAYATRAGGSVDQMAHDYPISHKSPSAHTPAPAAILAHSSPSAVRSPSHVYGHIGHGHIPLLIVQLHEGAEARPLAAASTSSCP